jgi:uncharacterized protein
MAAKFVLSSTKDKKFSFNLKAGNGEVILTSQSYASKETAKAGVESVRKNSQKDEAFDRKEAKDGSPFFTLVATNKEIIGKSEMYSSKSSMENGIKSVAKNAPDAVVVDETA